jgi:hypothetical protein
MFLSNAGMSPWHESSHARGLPQQWNPRGQIALVVQREPCVHRRRMIPLPQRCQEPAAVMDLIRAFVMCTISEHPWQRSAPYTLLWCKIFCMLRRYSCLTF